MLYFERRLDVAIYCPLRVLVPADIERAKLWEELKLTVGKVVVNPIRQSTPISSLCVVPIGEPGYDHACHRSLALSIWYIPDVACEVLFVGTAVMAVLISEIVDRGRAVAGTHRDSAERRVEWFEQLHAKMYSIGDCKIRVLRDVLYAVNIGNLAV